MEGSYILLFLRIAISNVNTSFVSHTSPVAMLIFVVFCGLYCLLWTFTGASQKVKVKFVPVL